MGRAYQQTRVLVTWCEPGAPSSIRPRLPDADSPEPMRHEPTRGRPSDLAAASRGGELVHGTSRTMLPSPAPDGLWLRPLELERGRSPIVRRIRCPVHAAPPGRRLTPPRRAFPPEVRPSPRQTMPSPRSSSFLALLLARSRLLASSAASPIRPSERANSADWTGIAGAHIVSDVCRIRSALWLMRVLRLGFNPEGRQHSGQQQTWMAGDHVAGRSVSSRYRGPQKCDGVSRTTAVPCPFGAYYESSPQGGGLTEAVVAAHNRRDQRSHPDLVALRHKRTQLSKLRLGVEVFGKSGLGQNRTGVGGRLFPTASHQPDGRQHDPELSDRQRVGEVPRRLVSKFGGLVDPAGLD